MRLPIGLALLAAAATLSCNRARVPASTEVVQASPPRTLDSAAISQMVTCTGTGGPSVMVEVRDPQGRPAALGTSIAIQDGSFVDSVLGTMAYGAHVGAGERRPGTYEVRLYKPGYKPVVLHGVGAPAKNVACAYATPTDVRRVTLELLPKAPAVRSVVVLPTGAGLGGPRYSVLATATVDANDGISRAVIWRSSDESVLRAIRTSDTTAMLCPRSKSGTVTVSATSVADRSVSGSSVVTVSIRRASGDPALDTIPGEGCRAGGQ